jgi:hypothetical protein
MGGGAPQRGAGRHGSAARVLVLDLIWAKNSGISRSQEAIEYRRCGASHPVKARPMNI